MTRKLIQFILIALTILTLPLFVPGIQVASFGTALFVAFFFGVFNTIVRPIILLITFPITIITLGLFSFVVNAFLFWFIGLFVKGFMVQGFIPALLGSLVISIVNSIVNRFD